jgi:hypothetical protein
MRAQDIIRDVPSRFVEATNAAELIRLASGRCCGGKRVLPTSDQGRAVPIRGFVCTGCGTAWNIPDPLWERTVALLPQGYRDYFETSEGVRALCAAMDAGAPGVPRGR